MTGEARVRPGGQHIFLRNVALDSNNKTILTVPAGKLVEILYMVVAYTSTATVGNRRMLVQINAPAAAVVFQNYSSSTQAATLTYRYLLTPGVINTAVIVDQVTMNLPTMYLPEGYVVYVLDSATVDAFDDMLIYMEYIQYDVA